MTENRIYNDGRKLTVAKLNIFYFFDRKRSFGSPQVEQAFA